MKYIFLLPVLMVVFVSCTQSVKGRNGVTYKSAVEYNDYIVNKQKALQKNTASIGEAADKNLDSADVILDNSVALIENMIADIEGMPPYKGDSSMRDAAIRSFKFYKKIFSQQYREIIEIRKQGGNQTEEGTAKMTAIVDDITKQEEGFDKAFHNAQKDFATLNHMKLEEGTIGEKKQ